MSNLPNQLTPPSEPETPLTPPASTPPTLDGLRDIVVDIMMHNATLDTVFTSLAVYLSSYALATTKAPEYVVVDKATFVPARASMMVSEEGAMYSIANLTDKGVVATVVDNLKTDTFEMLRRCYTAGRLPIKGSLRSWWRMENPGRVTFGVAFMTYPK